MAITEDDIKLLVNISKLKRFETGMQRIPISVENELNEKIANGLYEEIHLSPFSKIEPNVGSMAGNIHTHYTYLVVASIASWSRIAIQNGVSPDDSFDLSDALLYALSYAKDLDEIHMIYQLSATMYAKLVHAHKAVEPSYKILQIQNYISQNIFKKISIAELAEYTELSQNYLCNLFSKEMGISLHNYIQREKITVSCNLLKNTQRPISDVATYMGFQTQSNFTVVFRKWMHMTPREYREKNYREVY